MIVHCTLLVHFSCQYGIALRSADVLPAHTLIVSSVFQEPPFVDPYVTSTTVVMALALAHVKSLASICRLHARVATLYKIQPTLYDYDNDYGMKRGLETAAIKLK